MTTKTLEEWERELGFIAVGLDPATKMTEEEVNAIPLDARRGVDWEWRLAFLKDNGYEATRENIENPALSAKPPVSPN